MSANICRPTFVGLNRDMFYFSQTFTADKMEGEWSDECIEKLINFYESHSILYDTRMADYCNKDKKRALENELAEILNKSGNYLTCCIYAGLVCRILAGGYSMVSRVSVNFVL